MRSVAFTPLRITMQNVCWGLFAFVIVIDSTHTSNTTSEVSFIARQHLTKQDIAALFKAHIDDKLCAQTDICQNRTEMTSVYVNSHPMQCCKDCSCDEKCAFYNDCCFSDMNANELHEREECLYPLSDQTQGDDFQHETFYMITTCNGTHNCSDFEQTPWDAFLPVYSPSHHKIYVNEQCAMCNGLRDVKPWHPYIVCHGGASTSDIDAIVSAAVLRKITSNCNVHFIYPYEDAYTMSKLQCYKTRFESCPDNLEVERNPNHRTVLHELGLDFHTVVDLCHSSLESVYTQQEGNRYFKNIFCFLCSGRSLSNKKCTNELRKNTEKFGNFDFAMLLTGKTVGVLNATIAPIEACKLNNDSKTNLSHCRVLHCPVGQVRNSKGECFYASKLWIAGRVWMFVKLILARPIKLSPNTKISDVKGLFNDINFHIDSALQWDIVKIYFNFIVEANFVMIDFFAIEMTLQVDMFDPSEFLNDMKAYLNKKWLVQFSNVSESCSQEFLPYQLSTLYDFLQQPHTNGERAFMDEVYNLIRIDRGIKFYVFNSFLISETFFCNMLAFSEDEIQLLHNSMVVYLIEFDKYFGDMEFVLFFDARGKVTVKVCMERLPFKQVVEDAVNSMRKTITSWVLISGWVIVQTVICF